METIKENLLQTRNIDFVSNTLGTELWTQVCGHKRLNHADAGFWCGLVSPDCIEELYVNTGWDIEPHHQGTPGFEGIGGKYHYKSNLLEDGYESLLFYRDFHGVESDYVELSQEFVLLNDLRFDAVKKAYYVIKDNGELEEVAKYHDDTTILVKTKYLRQYSAAKQMAIVLFFDIRVKLSGCLLYYGLSDFSSNCKKGNLFYELWSGDMDSERIAYSVLMGKKILMPMPVEKCGYWPYEKAKEYQDFIVGVDENGIEKYYTCNPHLLANSFKANSGIPNYLTPVFFKREVLKKYIDKPELYEVEDGYLRCKSLWGIAIDNHHKNCVSVYLGDLGRDLPESEQTHWKNYNIVAEKGISLVSFQRDFLCIPADSNMADHRFQFAFKEVSKKWKKVYGWELFLPLTRDDEYNYTHLHIPFGDSQPEFDQQVLSLVKTIIDSLNEKELKRTSDCDASVTGSINRLKAWLEHNNAVGFEEHISFLRDLQALRSSGTGHRKGTDYNQIAQKFGLNEKSTIEVFESILNRAIDFLKYLENTFLL